MGKRRSGGHDGKRQSTMTILPLMKAQPLQRAAALLEVLGVYLAGGLVTSQLSRLFGVPLDSPLRTFTSEITNAELIAASRQMFVILSMQYAGWFLLAFPINWWHRRRGPASYGLNRGRYSWTALLGIGLVTAALAEWPVLGVSVADSLYDLGETAPWRQAFFDTSWQRWEFWLFSGVMSWGLVAVAEELFFRGYCQRRLAEDWGDGVAILGTACLFTFAHSQYLLANAYSLGMITSLFVLAVGLGLAFAWTRSLVPSVLAHSIINVSDDTALAGCGPCGICDRRNSDGPTRRLRYPTGVLGRGCGPVRRSRCRGSRLCRRSGTGRTPGTRCSRDGATGDWA